MNAERNVVILEVAQDRANDEDINEIDRDQDPEIVAVDENLRILFSLSYWYFLNICVHFGHADFHFLNGPVWYSPIGFSLKSGLTPDLNPR